MSSAITTNPIAAILHDELNSILGIELTAVVLSYLITPSGEKRLVQVPDNSQTITEEKVSSAAESKLQAPTHRARGSSHFFGFEAKKSKTK